jgi:hypothetical protein
MFESDCFREGVKKEKGTKIGRRNVRTKERKTGKR